MDACGLSNEEILSLVKAKHIPAYKLETAIDNPERGVAMKEAPFRISVMLEACNTYALLTKGTL